MHTKALNLKNAIRLAALGLALGLTADGFAQTQTTAAPGARAGGRGGRGGGPVQGVYKMSIEPHWFHDNTCFWYRNDLKGGTKEFILVNAEKSTRQHAFDHSKLAASLSKAAGQSYTGDKLPFSEIEFVDNEAAVHLYRSAGFEPNRQLVMTWYPADRPQS